MELTDAIKLVIQGIEDSEVPQVWADLGCGKGLFTRALSTLLPSDSLIFAVDTQPVTLPDRIEDVRITQVMADFTGTDPIFPNPLDGIVLANSFHYVKEKDKLLTRLSSLFRHQVRMIFIEYETTASNPWIPYPINFAQLTHLLSEGGFTEVRKIGEQPSIFGSNKIYSALALG